MIKEIVDIGRVSNRLGSVFTFKRVPEFYVEIFLEKNGKSFNFISNSKPKEIEDRELYLDYGLFSGKSGSNLFMLPSSFMINLTCDYSKLEESRIELQKDIEDKKLLKKIETQYKTEYTKFKKDTEQFEKIIESGDKVLIKFFEELRKEKLNDCKERIIYEVEKKDFKTKKDKAQYKKELTARCNNRYKKGKKYKLLNYLQTISKIILNNSEEIIKIADICKKYILAKDSNMKIDRVPVILRLTNKQGKPYFLHEKYFIFKMYEKLIFNNSAQKLKTEEERICNIYHKKEKLFAPKSSFYYAYSLDKVNVYPNLNKQETLNLFNLSYKAYIDFLGGRTFLEIYNNFYFMGLNSYVTATSLNDESLKEFQNDIRESKRNLDSLVNLIDKNRQNRFDILLNFYFFEPTKTGNNIVEYVKDIIPSNLVQNIKLFKTLRDDFYKIKFNKNLQFNWQQHIYNIYYKDIHKKYRTSLFRQIALGDTVNRERLMQIINENMEFGVNKREDDDIIKKGNFPRYNAFYYIQNGKEKRKIIAIEHLMFLDWLNKINKGEIKMSKDERNRELFVGKSYEERLEYFLENGNLVKDSNSMKVGVCVGLSVNILSWTLSSYDKKTLAFVSKRVERNNLNSVQIFMNEIFSKTKFQEYEGLQSVNIRLATMQMLGLDNSSFNKDEFIFGLFLGSELYQNVKSEKDPKPNNNENEGKDNEQPKTGE